MALTIDPKQIAEIAGKIKEMNVQLDETLKSSQSTVQSLKIVWTGQASEATIGAFNNFAQKYFENYTLVVLVVDLDLIPFFAHFL